MVRNLKSIKNAKRWSLYGKDLSKLLKDIETYGLVARNEELFCKITEIHSLEAQYIIAYIGLGFEYSIRFNHPLANGDDEHQITLRHSDHTETMVTRHASFAVGFALSYLKLCIKAGRLF